MKWIWSLLLLCLGGCSGSHRSMDSEVVSIPLVGEAIHAEPLMMSYPARIRVMDSLLFVADLNPATHFIHVFSKSDLSPRFSFCAKGRGEMEMVSLGDFALDRTHLYVMDRYGVKIHIYSLAALLHGERFPQQVLTCDKQVGIPAGSFCLTEEGYVFSNTAEESRVLFLDTAGRVVDQRYHLPEGAMTAESLPQGSMATLWGGSMAYNPVNHLLCLGTRLGDVLEIYNLANDSACVKIGAGGMPALLQEAEGVSLGTIDGFYDVWVADRAIYALFSGADRAALSKLWDQNVETPEGGTILRSYDLSGALRVCYTLDRHIVRFALDGDTTLYATDPNQGQIVRYRLPQ